MAVNPSKFFLFNITDTCSVWNILSSKTLYAASVHAKCIFSCTLFVMYECLFKPRKYVNNHEIRLKNRLKKEQKNGNFVAYKIDIEDLQDVFLLEKRQQLSKGELSSIVFAKKTRQAFLTDDQSARKLAESFMEKTLVQTTPHLYGWLVYSNYLNDSDKEEVIREHVEMRRPLKKYFEEMHLKALECKLQEYCRVKAEG